MAWPYSLNVGLNEEQQANRRRLLDAYGQFAQLSVLLLPLFYQLYTAIRLISTRYLGQSTSRPVKDHGSPLPPGQKRVQSPISRKGLWLWLDWMSGDTIAQGWGTWRHWLLAVLWTFWLLVLIVKDTGDDYIHVTRRFGIIAASQLPLHYLLAAKAWNPIQYIARMSHEELNIYHRLLGRIIVLLMTCHACLYLNFYVQKGFLAKRIQDRDVILGLCAISTATILLTAALAKVRTLNYRIFFYSHVVLSMVLLPILYYHVSHLRLYILESAAIYIMLIVQRNVSQARVETTISPIKGASLLSITFPLSFLRNRSYAPGQHIYISFPMLKDKLRLNPFTIANLPNEDRKISVVARALTGSTLMLDRMGHGLQPQPLLIDGPYGAASYFPRLADYDGVLLVAGGVGATFTMPIYRQLLARNDGKRPNNLRFVWVVRDRREAEWGVQSLTSDSTVLPEGFEMYVTGRGGRGDTAMPTVDNDNAAIELQERESLLNDASESEGSIHDSKSMDKVRSGRPDLGRLVDQTFNESREKVAILVCGPAGMGAALRKEIGRWVVTGRDIFWHSEEFGW